MKQIILLIILLPLVSIADISKNTSKEYNSYTIKNNGTLTLLSQGKELLKNIDTGKENGKILNSKITVFSNNHFVTLGYKCFASQVYHLNQNYKQENITLLFDDAIFNKLNFISGKEYFITFENKTDNVTASGLSNCLKRSTPKELTFKIDDSKKIRELFQEGGDLKIIVRNTTTKIPEIILNFDGFKEGYDKIKECIESK